MAVDTSQFRNGLKIELDGEPFTMIYFQHVKPGKGGAFVRTKVKNLTGRVLDRTFRSGERLEEADVVERKMQYLYQDGEDLVFMDAETFEQIPFSAAQVGDARKWLEGESRHRGALLARSAHQYRDPLLRGIHHHALRPGAQG